MSVLIDLDVELYLMKGYHRLPKSYLSDYTIYDKNGFTINCYSEDWVFEVAVEGRTIDIKGHPIFKSTAGFYIIRTPDGIFHINQKIPSHRTVKGLSMEILTEKVVFKSSNKGSRKDILLNGEIFCTMYVDIYHYIDPYDDIEHRFHSAFKVTLVNDKKTYVSIFKVNDFLYNDINDIFLWEYNNNHYASLDTNRYIEKIY